jgi:hypothetical protein
MGCFFRGSIDTGGWRKIKWGRHMIHKRLRLGSNAAYRLRDGRDSFTLNNGH